MWNSKGYFFQGIPVLLLVFAVFLAVGAGADVGDHDTDCASLAANADCSFYDVCIEAVMQCGPTGYAEGYGKKYCQRFGDPQYNDLFDQEGKEWIDKVRVCLMNKLLDPTFYSQLMSGALSCEDIMDYAFDTHPDCYVSAGFCTDIALDPNNLYALFSTFDLGDIASANFVKQVWTTAQKCLSDLFGK